MRFKERKKTKKNSKGTQEDPSNTIDEDFKLLFAEPNAYIAPEISLNVPKTPSSKKSSSSESPSSSSS